MNEGVNYKIDIQHKHKHKKRYTGEGANQMGGIGGRPGSGACHGDKANAHLAGCET